jgi:alkylhydroperoxidase/carboxymuconolactone decarboxylase family protein YurZ
MGRLAEDLTLLSLAQEVERDALETMGELSAALRCSLANWARGRALGLDGSAVQPGIDLPAAELAEQVAQCSTEVDLRAALKAGLSEEQVLELVLAATVGSGLARLTAGLSALGRKP